MAQIKYFKIKVTVGSVAGKYPLGNIPGSDDANRYAEGSPRGH